MLVFILVPGDPAADHKAPVGQTAVVLLQFFLTDEVDGGVIIREIVGHGHNGLFHRLGVGPFFQHHITFPGVLLPGGQFRLAAAAHRFQGCFHRHRILLGVFDTGNPADGVTVALADPFAPEGIILSFRQDGVAVQPGQGKQAGIPAYGNNSQMAGSPGRLVHCCKMFRDPGMGVEAVDHVEHPGHFRSLHRQIRSAAAAEDQHIDAVLPVGHILYIDHRHIGRGDFPLGRTPAGEHRCQFHIRRLLQSTFHTPSQIAISQDPNSNGHKQNLPSL